MQRGPVAVRFDHEDVAAAGDRFVLEANTGGIGDNRNGLALGGLRNAALLGTGTLSLRQAFDRAAGQVGSLSAQAQTEAGAAESLLRGSESSQAAFSGVNLDEEAAKMLEYENAYNASARLIQVADQLFDVLLDAF